MNAINLKDLSLGNFDQVMEIDEVKGGCCLIKIVKKCVISKPSCFPSFSKSSWGCKKQIKKKSCCWKPNPGPNPGPIE